MWTKLKFFLEEAKVKLEDVHSIKMVGCVVRTPIIQNIIKEVFGKAKTLLPDEAINYFLLWIALILMLEIMNLNILIFKVLF